MTPWKFYGRKDQLSVLAELLSRKRWFELPMVSRIIGDLAVKSVAES